MKAPKKNFVSSIIKSSVPNFSVSQLLDSVLEEMASSLPGELNNNISVSGISNPTKSLNNPNYSDGTPRPQSDAARAQQKEALAKQEMTLDKFNTLQSTGYQIKKDNQGNFWIKREDGTIAKFDTPSTSQAVSRATSTTSSLPSVVENYDLEDAIREDNEVLAPIEDLDNPDAPSHPQQPEIEITIKPSYDMFAALPPLDLSGDLERAVKSSQQGMMPKVIVNDMPQVINDGPHGVVSPVPQKENIRSIEDDPTGLSVVGLDNDLALRLM